jgi:hypothetical protein
MRVSQSQKANTWGRTTGWARGENTWGRLTTWGRFTTWG